MTLRVAFVRMAEHPIPNRLLPPRLAESLLGAEIEIFDVEKAVRSDVLSMVINPIFVARETGWNLLRGRVRPWQAFFTTTWMFRRMSLLAKRFVERGGFTLSFQMQSLFDAHSPDTPHFVYTDHTHLANLEYRDFDRRTLRGPRWTDLERALYAHAATIFTRSRNISRSLESDYACPADRIACVGAGSNTSVPDASAVSPEKDRPEILFVGVDWERKGGPDLLAAFERVRVRFPRARLSIVGCEPEVDAANVSVVGRRPLAEIPTYYERASIFCLPTRREPFGVVIIEALHHGLPVVATRVGAIPDLVRDGETGFLVEPGDVAGLADRLCQLIEDEPLRKTLSRAARDEARSVHTWESVAKRMAECIEAVLVATTAESRSQHPAEPIRVPASKASESERMKTGGTGGMLSS